MGKQRNAEQDAPINSGIEESERHVAMDSAKRAEKGVHIRKGQVTIHFLRL